MLEGHRGGCGGDSAGKCGASATPITITLHTDRYTQLAQDADIVAALQAKNIALEGTGGSISLVSA